MKMCVAKENLLNSEKEVEQNNATSDNNNNWSQLFRKVNKQILLLLYFFC